MPAIGSRFPPDASRIRLERTVENIRHHTLPCLHPYYGVVNADGVDHYSRYFDDETRAAVAAYFAADIREFAFRFENA